MSYNKNIPSPSSPPEAEKDPEEAILIKNAADGGNDAYKTLSDKYAPLINSMAARYGGKKGGGVSMDDLVQEAHIAFLGAVRSYDPEKKGVTFGLYAKICIRNKLVSCLRKSSKKVFGGQVGDGIAPSVAEKERPASLSDIGNAELSRYERAALAAYLDGRSYKDIAKELGRSEKSVDNALLRVRNKLRAAAKPKSTPIQKGDDN